MASEDVFLSTNAAVDGIISNDSTVEVIGYVDVVESSKIVGKNKKYILIKFVLNNGDGRRIQCIAWEMQVDRTATAIELNMIIYLAGTQSKKIENPNFNVRNTLFELFIHSNTIITNLGTYGSGSYTEVLEVPLSEVADASGKIKVIGYMKTLVALAENEQGKLSQGIDAIADGEYKLEIHTTSTQKLPDLTKGDPFRAK